jgi:hypothetical protein
MGKSSGNEEQGGYQQAMSQANRMPAERGGRQQYANQPNQPNQFNPWGGGSQQPWSSEPQMSADQNTADYVDRQQAPSSSMNTGFFGGDGGGLPPQYETQVPQQSQYSPNIPPQPVSQSPQEIMDQASQQQAMPQLNGMQNSSSRNTGFFGGRGSQQPLPQQASPQATAVQQNMMGQGSMQNPRRGRGSTQQSLLGKEPSAPTMTPQKQNAMSRQLSGW